MNIIAICNQKGGVAKTTTAVNLAASLGERGRRCLVIDLDPQGNATMGCGVEKRDLESSMLDICLKEEMLDKVIHQTKFDRLDVAPANQDLTVAEVKMQQIEKAPFILKSAFEELDKENKYDYVIIDCPPALNILTVNAMTAANYVVVPIQCEYYALEGLTSLLDTISDLRSTTNNQLEILGFLRTMFDSRSRLGAEVSAQLESFLKEKVFETIIPRNVRLAEAPSYGMPAIYYDRSSKGAVAYRKLALEVIDRVEKN